MAKPGRSNTVNVDHRKARGSGHERRGEILAAARELFLEQGIESVSTRQIAARVGISQTALYMYFANKEEMLDALVLGAFARLFAALTVTKADPTDLVGCLRSAMRAYIRFGLDNPDEYRLAFLLRDARHRTGASPAGLDSFEFLETLVRDGVVRGAFRSTMGQGRETAQSIWAAIHGLVALLIAYPEFGWVPAEQLIEMHIGILLDGVVLRPAMGLEEGGPA